MNRYKFTHHKPLDGSLDFWRLTVESDGPTKEAARANMLVYGWNECFPGYESAPPAEPIDAPADAAADIFDLTARVAALERECVELRRLLSGVVPMGSRPHMPPGVYFDPPQPFPATGPGWPLSPGSTCSNPNLVGPGSWVKPDAPHPMANLKAAMEEHA